MTVAPNSRSPSFNTDLIIASGEIMMFSTCKPARSTVFRKLWRTVLGPVYKRPRISKRIPIIPRGSRIPWKPSTVNSSGIKVMTSRSGVILFVKADLTTFSTSASVISFESLVTGIIP